LWEVAGLRSQSMDWLRNATDEKYQQEPNITEMDGGVF
jgi:hypothetical protein